MWFHGKRKLCFEITWTGKCFKRPQSAREEMHVCVCEVLSRDLELVLLRQCRELFQWLCLCFVCTGRFGLPGIFFLFVFFISDWKSLLSCLESVSLSNFTLTGCIIKAQETGHCLFSLFLLRPHRSPQPPHKSWQATQFSSHSRTLRPCLLTWKWCSGILQGSLKSLCVHL